MVKWLKILRHAERCGHLCRSVQDEVASMARAHGIERLVHQRQREERTPRT